MKLLSIILPIFFVSCGDITVTENGNGNKLDATYKEGEGLEENKSKKKTTVTVTIEEDIYGEGSSRELLATYEAINDDKSNDNFVSLNFCSGISFRDCYLGKFVLKEYSDGNYKVFIETIDTFTDEYKFEMREVISENKSFLLFNDGKVSSDDSIDPRGVWVKLDVKEKSIDLIYDYAGSGPGGVGSEVLDTIFLTEKDK